MIQTICSTLFCLQSTLAPGQLVEIKQHDTYVTIKAITNVKYMCGKINNLYHCQTYQ